MMTGLVTIVDLVAVAVFAVSGALAAAEQRLDMLGFILFGTITGVGGGTVRDLLLGTDVVFWFADTRYLQITLEIPARLMPGLRVGMMVPARLDVGNARVDARVAQIFPAADVERHTVRVKLDLPQGIPGGPGMYAEVMIPDINAPMNTLPAIPESAVVWRGSLPGVFVVGTNNETQLRLLRLGDYVSSGTVSVLSGLRVGERIYANPPPGMGSSWSRREPGTQPQ